MCLIEYVHEYGYVRVIEYWMQYFDACTAWHDEGRRSVQEDCVEREAARSTAEPAVHADTVSDRSHVWLVRAALWRSSQVLPLSFSQVMLLVTRFRLLSWTLVSLFCMRTCTLWVARCTPTKIIKIILGVVLSTVSPCTSAHCCYTFLEGLLFPFVQWLCCVSTLYSVQHNEYIRVYVLLCWFRLARNNNVVCQSLTVKSNCIIPSILFVIRVVCD